MPQNVLKVNDLSKECSGSCSLLLQPAVILSACLTLEERNIYPSSSVRGSVLGGRASYQFCQTLNSFSVVLLDFAEVPPKPCTDIDSRARGVRSSAFTSASLWQLRLSRFPGGAFIHNSAFT